MAARPEELPAEHEFRIRRFPGALVLLMVLTVGGLGFALYISSFSPFDASPWAAVGKAALALIILLALWVLAGVWPRRPPRTVHVGPQGLRLS